METDLIPWTLPRLCSGERSGDSCLFELRLTKSIDKLVVSPSRWSHPPQLSFPILTMSTLTDLASTAGSVFVVAISATTFLCQVKASTAEAKVAALRRLLDKAQAAHREVTKDLLPDIPEHLLTGELAVNDLEKRTWMLNRWDSLHAPPPSAEVI